MALPTVPSVAADVSVPQSCPDWVDYVDDNGVTVEIVDVVGGVDRWAIDALVDVHAHAFPGYAFAIAEIEANYSEQKVLERTEVYRFSRE